MAKSPQFISDENGNKTAIVIPLREYNHMMEELEEFHDIKLYDEVKAREEKSIPLEQYLEHLNKTGKHV
ncbi:MAG: hypothetical protein WCI71_03990 [Bacteroidota bacterium]